jgi:hypothetical protein
MASDRSFIAERKLVAIDAQGREFEFTIAIGAPYEVSEGEWACPASMEGLHRLRDMHGVDSWQAMQLACQLIAQMLTYFVADGGRLFWPDTREQLAPEELFPRFSVPV